MLTGTARHIVFDWTYHARRKVLILKYVIALVVGFLALASMISWAIMHFPTERRISYNLPFFVPEQSLRTVTKEVEIDGKTVEVSVDIVDTHEKPVFEMREISVPPTQLQQLQYWCLVGVAIIFGLYMLSVLGLWVKDKIAGKGGTNATREIQNRLDGVVGFCTGILIGFLANTDFTEQPNLPPKAIVNSDSTTEQQFEIPNPSTSSETVPF